MCIARATVPVINITIILMILPVCKTFNNLVYKALRKVSMQLLTFYLEKLKVVHQCLAVTLVFTCGELVVDDGAWLKTDLSTSLAIHSVAHSANAINFLRKYDARMPELNWARDSNDVRSTTVLKCNIH